MVSTQNTYAFNAIEGSELIVSGRDVDTAPRHINTARLNWVFMPSASAELEWISIGRYYVDASNEHTYPGHDLLNLRVGWDFGANWAATLRVNNVLDEDYADRADFAFGNFRYFPGRDRSAFVEVRYQTR